MTKAGIASDVEERRAAIERRHPSWASITLDTYFVGAARTFADRPLVVVDGLTMTYAEIDEEAGRIAYMLAGRGVLPGDRVAMLMGNYPITVALLFGIWRSGAVAVPLNTLYRADELSFVLAQSAPRLLVAMTGFASRNFAAELETIAPAGLDILLFDASSAGDCALRRAVAAAPVCPCRRTSGMFTSGWMASPKAHPISRTTTFR